MLRTVFQRPSHAIHLFGPTQSSRSELCFESLGETVECSKRTQNCSRRPKSCYLPPVDPSTLKVDSYSMNQAKSWGRSHLVAVSTMLEFTALRHIHRIVQPWNLILLGPRSVYLQVCQDYSSICSKSRHCCWLRKTPEVGRTKHCQATFCPTSPKVAKVIFSQVHQAGTTPYDHHTKPNQSRTYISTQLDSFKLLFPFNLKDQSSTQPTSFLPEIIGFL